MKTQNKPFYPYIMKRYLTIILAIIAILTFSGCKNSQKQAAKDAEEFSAKICNLLEKHKQFKYPYEFTALADSCGNIIQVEWEKYKKNYQADSAAWNIFKDSYNKNILKTMQLFRSNYGKAIHTAISDTTWLREKEKKGYYLYSFKNDTLRIQNCKSGIPYQLHIDTLIFDDEAQTKAIVSFKKGDKLVINDLEGKEEATYTPMTEKSKFFGVWSMPGQDLYGIPLYVTFTYRANGTGTLTLRCLGETYSSGCTYSVSGHTLNQKCNMEGNSFNIHDRYTFSKNLNTVTITRERLVRQLKAFPKDLSILYK